MLSIESLPWNIWELLQSLHSTPPEGGYYNWALESSAFTDSMVDYGFLDQLEYGRFRATDKLVNTPSLQIIECITGQSITMLQNKRMSADEVQSFDYFESLLKQIISTKPLVINMDFYETTEDDYERKKEDLTIYQALAFHSFIHLSWVDDVLIEIEPTKKMQSLSYLDIYYAIVSDNNYDGYIEYEHNDMYDGNIEENDIELLHDLAEKYGYIVTKENDKTTELG